MKKFLLPLLLAFALLIPTVAAEAADVPDIRQISPNNIIPDYSIFNTDHSVYSYKCTNGNSYNYAAQFVQMLTRNYPDCYQQRHHRGISRMDARLHGLEETFQHS